MKVNRKLNRKTRILEIHRSLELEKVNLNNEKAALEKKRKALAKHNERIYIENFKIERLNELLRSEIERYNLQSIPLIGDECMITKLSFDIIRNHFKKCRSIVEESESIPVLTAKIAHRDSIINDINARYEEEVSTLKDEKAELQDKIDILLEQKAVYQERLINNKR